jgi:hypothetical protein
VQFCYKPKFDWCRPVTNPNLTCAVLLPTQIWLVQSCYKHKFDWCSPVTNPNLTGAVLLQTQIWLVQFCYKTCLKYPIWSFKHILLQIHHFITKNLKRLWKENLNALTHLTVNFFRLEKISVDQCIFAVRWIGNYHRNKIPLNWIISFQYYHVFILRRNDSTIC